MSKRINIGIYIGSDDSDIAAWFNLLRENKLNRSKWVRGLLFANALHEPLDIGTIVMLQPEKERIPAEASGLLFGIGNSQSQEKHKHAYGWHVRGANKEFIRGSVITVSLNKELVEPLFEQIRDSGFQVATFLKAIIRENLKYGLKEIPPDNAALQKILATFLICQVCLKNEKKKTPSSYHSEQSEGCRNIITDLPSQSPPSPVKEPSNEEQKAKAVNFTVQPNVPTQPVFEANSGYVTDDKALTPSPPHNTSKNPLLDKI